MISKPECWLAPPGVIGMEAVEPAILDALIGGLLILSFLPHRYFIHAADSNPCC